MSAVRIGALLAACLAAQAIAQTPKPADEGPASRKRTASVQLGLGGYKPNIDAENGLTGAPYDQTFGSGAMLLFQGEIDRFLWQKYGAAGVGFGFGYGEKYGPAKPADSTSTTTVKEKTALHVAPLRLLAVYRFDYGALHWGVPLVPIAKVGLTYMPWWITKGGGVEYFDHQRGAGGKWGYSLTAGMALMLDFLEPDLARDLATDTGVAHTYLIGEFIHDKVPGFGGSGLDLSEDHWMFSLAFDF